MTDTTNTGNQGTSRNSSVIWMVFLLAIIAMTVIFWMMRKPLNRNVFDKSSPTISAPRAGLTSEEAPAARDIRNQQSPHPNRG